MNEKNANLFKIYYSDAIHVLEITEPIKFPYTLLPVPYFLLPSPCFDSTASK